MTLTALLNPVEKKTTMLMEITLILLGSGLLALSAQISIPLPFSPVPITAQTFAVLLVGALLGRRLAAGSVLAYLAEGIAGLPVFAGGTSGLGRLLGPSGGYLVGFLVAGYVVGALAERGWTLEVKRTLLAMMLGNLLIYLCGVVYLSLFLGFEKALAAGLIPFLLGDAVKILLATLLLPLGWKGISKIKPGIGT